MSAENDNEPTLQSPTHTLSYNDLARLFFSNQNGRPASIAVSFFGAVQGDPNESDFTTRTLPAYGYYFPNPSRIPRQKRPSHLNINIEDADISRFKKVKVIEKPKSIGNIQINEDGVIGFKNSKDEQSGSS